jgi:hypothetical protein
MKQHYSPGPWKAKNVTGNHWTVEADSPHVKGKWQTVCELNGPWDEKNYKANALLIASAPDLVAVLAACITDDAQNIVDRGNAVRRLDHITRMARYAIKLAQTGESKDNPL